VCVCVCVCVCVYVCVYVCIYYGSNHDKDEGEQEKMDLLSSY